MTRRDFVPRSNAERQRQFRKRNPGYYGRLHARDRAARNARVAMMRLEAQRANSVPREPLMLPAPVEVIEFVRSPVRELVPSSRVVQDNTAA